MKISIAQINVIHKNKAENLKQISKLLAEADTIGDIVLLPELFTTGYIFESPKEIHKLAERYDNSKTIKHLSQLSKKYNTVIVAGIAERDNDKYFNSVAVVNESGLHTQYRKISQTNIDKQYFSRGHQLITFTHKDVTFGIAICFDIWFPEIVRNYAKQGVDILLHPANFGGKQSLLISRACAIQNSIYVVTCNRTGADITKTMTGDYCGASQICSPSGNCITLLGDETTLTTTEINIDHTQPKKIIGVTLNEEISHISNLLKK